MHRIVVASNLHALKMVHSIGALGRCSQVLVDVGSFDVAQVQVKLTLVVQFTKHNLVRVANTISILVRSNSACSKSCFIAFDLRNYFYFLI